MRESSSSQQAFCAAGCRGLPVHYRTVTRISGHQYHLQSPKHITLSLELLNHPKAPFLTYASTNTFDLLGSLGFLGPPKIFHLFPQHWVRHCLSNHMKAGPWCLQRALCDCSNYFPLMSHSVIIVVFSALQVTVLFESQLINSINQYTQTEVNSYSRQY